MIVKSRHLRWLEAAPSVRYIAPFVLFFIVVALVPALPLPLDWQAPLCVLLLAAVCVVCWPKSISIRPANALASVAVGALVFFLWIAPDILIPGYRATAPFSNAVVGHTHSSLPPAALRSDWILFWRTARAALVVPVVEELFWRAWMMRWLVNVDFWKVPLGTFTPVSFLVTAVLFASEHGPYWDVGLLTGCVYNWWMIRTKSVANCVLMHAVTNGLLSAYVIWWGQWQYWQ